MRPPFAFGVCSPRAPQKRERRRAGQLRKRRSGCRRANIWRTDRGKILRFPRAAHRFRKSRKGMTGSSIRAQSKSFGEKIRAERRNKEGKGNYCICPLCKRGKTPNGVRAYETAHPNGQKKSDKEKGMNKATGSGKGKGRQRKRTEKERTAKAALL